MIVLLKAIQKDSFGERKIYKMKRFIRGIWFCLDGVSVFLIILTLVRLLLSAYDCKYNPTHAALPQRGIQ